MRPFFWQGTTNFGDYMNQWLWPKILDGYLGEDDGIRLVGIGSLLMSSLNYLEGKKVIFGTGSGYGAIPEKSDYADWSFYFVRGPLTAECFRLPTDKAIVDGAWLISLLPQYQKIPDKKGIAFVPHWTTSETGVWRKICEMSDINYIDPLEDLETVFRKIATSEIVITESLHGAIMADYFRSPWVPVCISPKFLPFKWVDWCKSIAVDPEMLVLPLSDWFEYLYCKQSRDNINYDAKLEPISYSFAQKEDTPGAIKKAGNLYKAKIYLKGRARNVRGSLLTASKPLRDNPMLADWNNRHQALLAEKLVQISQGRTFLSKDNVRIEKIEKLHNVVEQLKKDYPRLAGK